MEGTPGRHPEVGSGPTTAVCHQQKSGAARRGAGRRTSPRVLLVQPSRLFLRKLIPNPPYSAASLNREKAKSSLKKTSTIGLTCWRDVCAEAPSGPPRRRPCLALYHGNERLSQRGLEAVGENAPFSNPSTRPGKRGGGFSRGLPLLIINHWAETSASQASIL